MPVNLTLSLGTLLGFLLVLTRVAGAFVFVPLPGLSSVIAPVRIAFALGFTLALSPRWPVVQGGTPALGVLAGWIGAEAAAGIAVGVSVGIVIEAFTVAAQVLGLPAGYGYASTIDPTTQADAGILVVLAQLVGGMLFFSLGLDREILRLFAESLDHAPAGTYLLNANSAGAMIHLGSSLFSVGVRLALPVVALLVMVDVALALMGRLNAQLQLLSLAFPAKMLVALLVLAWTAPLYPRIFWELSGHAWGTARKLLGM
jgi:flagellar biosynthetic protein FliR